jgi:predicted alpha-1,6-mannanase (GH76 family)
MKQGGFRVSCLTCCLLCWVGVTILSLGWGAGPISQFANEVHFSIGASLRVSSDLNRLVTDGLRNAFKRIDVYGTHNTSRTLALAVFRDLDANKSYLALARECIRGLHQLHPVAMHNAWYHGIHDAWAVWALMIMSCSVVDCNSSKEFPYDMESTHLRTILAWRGLSGSSDDILWATLAILQYSPRFWDMDYRLNGARGAVHLYAEAEKHFVVRIGNMTSLFWDTNKNYQSTISITLWITASCKLHVLTGDERYLENAKSAYHTLEQLNLLNHGQVFDGVKNKSVFQTRWTYNAGMALGALTALYQSTNDHRFLAVGQEVTKASFDYFWHNGHLRETGMMEELLYPDQYSFKGLFLHYLERFLEVARNASRLDPEWVRKLKSKCEEECKWLVTHRLREDGFCVYWGEATADRYCSETERERERASDRDPYAPQGMVAASQLFMLTHHLQAWSPGPISCLNSIENTFYREHIPARNIHQL